MRLRLYILALLLISPPSWAQDPAPTLEKPPKLIDLVPADIPEGTEFPYPEVQVLLEIEVNETGKVSQVRVIEGPGDPFNTAAQEAAKKFTFEPALLSTGENVPVTINFRMRITQPVPVPAPDPVPEPLKQPDPVTYTGTLTERGTRKPLAGVEVQARSSAETLATTATDDQGRFRLKVPATKFTLTALPPGHERLEAQVEAQPGEEREETFYSRDRRQGVNLGIRVVVGRGLLYGLQGLDFRQDVAQQSHVGQRLQAVRRRDCAQHVQQLIADAFRGDRRNR